jgi:hypothetical protein
MLAELAAIGHALERPVTAPQVGDWARRLAPAGIGREGDAMDLALQNLLGGGRPRTATARPVAGMAFVTRSQQDGTTLWEPAPPPPVRRRPKLALGAALLPLALGVGLLALRPWRPAAPAEPTPAPAAVPVPAPSAPPSFEPRASPPPHPRPAARPTPPGFLNVYADPWAYVRVDGKPVGTTPLLKLPVAAGSHRVQLESPNAQSAQRQVRIAAGETQLISVDLSRKGAP